jgi:hypothetical protein
MKALHLLLPQMAKVFIMLEIFTYGTGIIRMKRVTKII